MDDDTLQVWRYVFGRVLIPCVTIIGVLGNLVNVIVLTRRRMRCSTNVYLTALAVSDIVFLVFAFIYSLQRYPNWDSIKHELYWRFFGIIHWFCDASSYTSIFLTVSFTIERYIVVCHPFRGQIYIKNSTKNAKRVIAAVVIFCFLSTLTTALEYRLNITCYHIETDLECNCTFLTIPSNSTKVNVDSIEQLSVIQSSTSEDLDELNLATTPSTLISTDHLEQYVNEIQNATCTLETQRMSMSVTNSTLKSNEIYAKVFFNFTWIVFYFIPLILLSTFNYCLVAAVRRSSKTRHRMTNNRQNSSHTMLAQENKITIILIAVIVLFIICHTPNAVFLFYDSWFTPPEEGTPEYNMLLAFGNVINFLLTLNAASNFILYCALSDVYRQTIKALLFRRKHQRQNTLTSTCITRLSVKDSHSRGSFYSNPSNKREQFRRKPTFESSTKRPSIPTSQTPRLSIPMQQRESESQNSSYLPSDYLNSNTNSIRKDSNSSIQMQISSLGSPQPQPPSPNGTRFLNPSPSSASLTRSQSVILTPPIKHSPDCKCHPDNASKSPLDQENPTANGGCGE